MTGSPQMTEWLAARETKIQVAVVDDDPSFLRALERLLSAAGFGPLGYASAESFLHESPHPPMDCLILDVRLGAITGFDVARQLAAEGSRVPIIFITAHDEPGAQEQAAEAGGVAYLRKPFTAPSLVEAIRLAVLPHPIPPEVISDHQPHEPNRIQPPGKDRPSS